MTTADVELGCGMISYGLAGGDEVEGWNIWYV